MSFAPFDFCPASDADTVDVCPVCDQVVPEDAEVIVYASFDVDGLDIWYIIHEGCSTEELE